MRLVRDVPVGTPAWKELYHRGRNAVESRNAAFEHEGLKRMLVFGLPRVKALIFQADASGVAQLDHTRTPCARSHARCTCDVNRPG